MQRSQDKKKLDKCEDVLGSLCFAQSSLRTAVNVPNVTTYSVAIFYPGTQVSAVNNQPLFLSLTHSLYIFLSFFLSLTLSLSLSSNDRRMSITRNAPISRNLRSSRLKRTLDPAVHFHHSFRIDRDTRRKTLKSGCLSLLTIRSFGTHDVLGLSVRVWLGFGLGGSVRAIDSLSDAV
eukprot:sb/3471845/